MIDGPWPDWSGETVVIVGTGPSAASAPLNTARGKARVVVIKRSWLLAPWADALYGIDKGWWIANHGAGEFKGLKFSPSPTVCQLFRDVRRIRLKARAEILTAETGVLGCGLRSGGGFSGFQAANLAVQFGAGRIILIGFEMTLEHGDHWHKDYQGVGKPERGRTESWRQAMDAAADQFGRLGVDVVNATPMSALMAYRKCSFDGVFGRG